MAYLVWTDAEQSTHRIEMATARLVIGRGSDAGLVLDDSTASRRHAAVTATEEGFLLIDLGSANGTWVNDQRVSRHLLRDGDAVRIGEVRLAFNDPPGGEPTVLVRVDELGQRPTLVAPPPPPPAAPPPRPLHPTAPVAAPAERPAFRPPPPPRRPLSRTAPAPLRHAGFWIRFAACLADSLLLAVMLVAILGGLTAAAALLGQRVPALQAVLVPLGAVVGALVPILYLVTGWARSGQTLGKRACGLRVVREGGSALRYDTAFVRLFGYFLSGLLLGVGYLMIAFSERKQGLHDVVAGTLVIRTR